MKTIFQLIVKSLSIFALRGIVMRHFTIALWFVSLTFSCCECSAFPFEHTPAICYRRTEKSKLYYALTDAINNAIASIYHKEITLIEYPSQGDFMWVYQNQNQIFNEGTFNYISARVSPGEEPGTARLSPAGSFPNSYLQVISGIEYTLSRSDQAIIEKSLEKVQIQSRSVISTYQNIFGEITDEDMKTAQSAIGSIAVSTRIDYIISYVLGYLWSGRQIKHKPPITYLEFTREWEELGGRNTLFPYMPPSGEPVLSNVLTYLKQFEPAHKIQSELQLGGWILSQMVSNTSDPNETNGGMKTVNPGIGEVSKKFQVGYDINSSLATIQNDLDNKQRKIKITIDVSRYNSRSLVFFLHRDAMHKIQGNSKVNSITIEYQGYSMVPIAPKAWQQATKVGWYYADPIAEAFKNGKKDITGFKFVSLPSYNLNSLAEGGNFGQITNLLISQNPTITVRYKNSDFRQFKKSWPENVYGKVILLGALKQGCSSKGEYSSKIIRGSSNSDFSLIFTPSQQNATVPQLQKSVYVIGGSFEFPAYSSKSVPIVRRLIDHMGHYHDFSQVTHKGKKW